MGAEDEREPLRREQLFSGTAAGQISECMTRGTYEAWVHTLTHTQIHTHPRCEMIRIIIYACTCMDTHVSFGHALYHSHIYRHEYMLFLINTLITQRTHMPVCQL